MKYGLSSEELNFLEEHLLRPLRGQNAKIWIFGSRARGDHRAFSDIDIMVEGRDLSALVSQIKEFFVESHFPYKIDLVELSSFADSYRAGFERDKVLL